MYCYTADSKILIILYKVVENNKLYITVIKVRMTPYCFRYRLLQQNIHNLITTYFIVLIFKAFHNVLGIY